MDAQKTIQTAIDSHDTLLFMKGTPELPQCGFSSIVCRILDYFGVEFTSVNVLDDETLRQGVKTYSNWPTVPQLYVKGEFVGGCDIVREMFENGELKSFLRDKGISMTEAEQTNQT